MGRKKDFFAGGNMFLYYSQQELKNEDFRDPDFFLVKGVDRAKERKTWTIWEEGFKFPIIELISETTYKIDLYEQTFKTPESMYMTHTTQATFEVGGSILLSFI